YRADAHLAQLHEALLDSAFDDVFQLDHAKCLSIFRDDEWSRAAPCNLVDCFLNGLRKCAAVRFDKVAHRFGGSFADMNRRLGSVSVEIDPAHARLCGERNKYRLELVHFSRAKSEFLFGEDDDAAAFGSFVCERA